MAKLETLSDGFATQDNVKWFFGTGTGVSGGLAFITPDTSYQGVYAAVSYDFTESYAGVQVATLPNVGNGSTSLLFAVGSFSANNRVQMFWANGTLYARWTNASGTDTQLASAPYDNTYHQWWMISETNGTIYCHTSPNGLSWDVFASVSTATTGISMSTCGTNIQAGYNGTEPNPGIGAFDNFNVFPDEVVKVPRSIIQVP